MSSSARPSFDRALAAVAALAALVSGCAVFYFFANGSILYYGDAEAHLNIARRVIDSRTPGWNQIGTVWLPLPHILLLPFVSNDWLWRTGLAGAIPSAVCYVAAAAFLFAAARRLFESAWAGAASAALLGLNPNLLYLQATPMNEPVMFAVLGALLYFAVRFRHRPTVGTAAAAGISALAGTLTRYEGWFILPFVGLYFFIAGQKRRFQTATLFSAIAGLGPLLWLAHNWWYFGNALDFYNGPYSALMIQGAAPYPGLHNWPQAWLYFRTAAGLCAGSVLFWLGSAGVLILLVKRIFWPLLFLALPPFFYIWSLHSSGNPIFVPVLWPHSYYNTRYGLALLPLAALAAGALVTLAPPRWHSAAAVCLVVLSVVPWISTSSRDAIVTWKESQINSRARREWTARAAAYIRRHYRPGDGILTSFGDITGVYRSAGIPLRRTLTGDNMPQWEATVVRPDLFLWEEWAVAAAGDRVEAALEHPSHPGPRFSRQVSIIVEGAPAVHIYRRSSFVSP